MIPTTDIEKLIVGLILVLFSWGLLSLLYQMFYKLWFEQRALKKVRTNEGNFRTTRIEKAPVLQRELLEGVPKKSAIYHRVASISEIRQRGGAIDQNALSDILVGRQSILGSFSRHVLGILIILGLVGTLVGLMIAIEEAKPMSDPNQLTDLEHIAGTIGGTLSGMKTAFSTTFWGLITTLVLGLISYGFNKKQSLFLNDLEDFTVKVLVPRFHPDSMATMLEVSDSLRRTSGAMDTATRKLTDVAWEVRLDESQQLVSSLEESTASLVKGLKDLQDLNYRIGGMLESFDEAAKAMKSGQDELSKTLGKSLPDLSNITGNLVETLSSYKEDQGIRFNKLLEDIARTMNEQNVLLNRELSNLFNREISEKMDRAVTAQENIAFNLNQLIDESVRSLNSENFLEQANLLSDIAVRLGELQQLPQAIQRLVGDPDDQTGGDGSFMAQFQLATSELKSISYQLPGESLMQRLASALDDLNSSVKQMNRNIEISSNRSLWKRFVSFPKRMRKASSRGGERKVEDATEDA